MLFVAFFRCIDNILFTSCTSQVKQKAAKIWRKNYSLQKKKKNNRTISKCTKEQELREIYKAWHFSTRFAKERACKDLEILRQ